MMDRWSLPEALEVQGRQYAINADFRDVLEVIRWLNNPDEDERVRYFVSLKLFFEDWDSIPQKDQEENFHHEHSNCFSSDFSAHVLPP